MTDFVGQGLAAIVTVLWVDVGLVLTIDQVPGLTHVRTRAIKRQVSECRPARAAIAIVAEGHVTVAA
ncbi:hypothetical protein D3C77_391240 [compost metagenome]